MPASLIKAMAAPWLRRSRICGPHLLGIVLVIGGEFRPDGEALHQPAARARVLAEHGFGGGERRERTDGDVAQLPMGVATTWRPGASGSASKRCAPMM